MRALKRYGQQLFQKGAYVIDIVPVHGHVMSHSEHNILSHSEHHILY